jgi:hypothetical protein
MISASEPSVVGLVGTVDPGRVPGQLVGRIDLDCRQVGVAEQGSREVREFPGSATVKDCSPEGGQANKACIVTCMHKPRFSKEEFARRGD